jgi:hypothetical protein
VDRKLETDPQGGTKKPGTWKKRCAVVETLTEPNQALHPTAAALPFSEHPVAPAAAAGELHRWALLFLMRYASNLVRARDDDRGSCVS